MRLAICILALQLCTLATADDAEDFLTSMHTRYKNQYGDVANATEDALDDRDDWETKIRETIENNVKIVLFTRKNPMHYNIIHWENLDNITTSHFDPRRKTKILIHGWLNSQNTSFPKNLKDAYLTRYDSNVIVVDWRPMSLWLYPWARKTVPYVADYVARFIGALVNAGVDPGGLHIVGHSLGAHLAGIAGLRANYTIGRITGLDPASPLFSYDESDRLCERSAAFVDVVHTCGLMLGFFSAIGHVDFYPNGGRPIQPGCKVDIDGECSHRRAHEYFVESVVTRGSFVATACDKWERFYSNRCRPPKYTQLGEDVPHTARGVYYLKTYGEEPFGMGRIGLT